VYCFRHEETVIVTINFATDTSFQSSATTTTSAKMEARSPAAIAIAG
jgi:hypothetical protein